jgi:hypothetical protein
LEASLPGNLRVADAYVPGAVTIGGASYREQAGDRFVGFDYDSALAGELLKEGLSELGQEKLPTLSILCPEEYLGVMGYLQKSIQEALGRKGFSLVEAVSPCPTHFGRHNQMKSPVAMLHWLKEKGIPRDKFDRQEGAEKEGCFAIGKLVDREEPDFNTRYEEIRARALNDGEGER